MTRTDAFRFAHGIKGDAEALRNAVEADPSLLTPEVREQVKEAVSELLAVVTVRQGRRAA